MHADSIDWERALRSACERIRRRTVESIARAHDGGSPSHLARAVREGAGDTTFGVDTPAEDALAEWTEELARRAPVSVLTEETGWRHLGPSPTAGSPVELDGFDHGGPRLAFDPIDGSRQLMFDMRSAWTVASFCPPGPAEPRLCDVELGVVAEVPTSRAARFRVLTARKNRGAAIGEHRCEGGAAAGVSKLSADEDVRVDRAYFPFFRYSPDLRPALAELEARFFARLAEHEDADPDSCYDDQYISNAGQLVLLTLGTYRMIADLRAELADRRGRPTRTSKPYDVAGALLVAAEAGCPVTDARGRPLDFPIDVETPVSFVGYANAATRARLEPHLRAVLDG